MYFWSRFPFLRFAVAFIAGIVVYDLAPLFWGNPHSLIFGTVLFFVVVQLVVIGKEKFHLAQGVLSLTLLVYLGGLSVQLHRGTNNPAHYLHAGTVEVFQARIISDQNERKDYYRFEAEVSQVVTEAGPKPATGKIHFYQKKSDQITPLKYGDVVLVKSRILPVEPPKNPGEFNFKRYLENQNIYGHVFASPDDYSIIGNDPQNPVADLGITIRKKALTIIQQAIPQPREQAIIEALILGVKDHLDNGIREAYSAAGAMHVLAVSGLHVGIIFLVITALLGFLKKKKGGKPLFVVIALLCIWLYALVTGFSASVLRAVIMFSVVLVSEGLGRHSYVYNSLGIAAIILLLMDPFVIYNVGFQLSFIAVFGIVYLHPRLYQLWEAPNTFLDYIWSISCVSIAAQIATFPLTMLYFHQFPTYFLVSNLVVIPASFCILVAGIVMILVGSLWSALGVALGYLVYGLVWIVNEFLFFLTKMPKPILDWLYFDLKDTLLVYAVLVLLAVAFSVRRKALLGMALAATFFWTGWRAWQDWGKLDRKEIVIYELKNQMAFDLVKGDQALLLIDSLDTEKLELLEYQINPFRLSNGLQPASTNVTTLDKSANSIKVPGGYLVVWEGYRVFLQTEKKAPPVAATADLVIFNHPYAMPETGSKKVIGTGMRWGQQKRLKERIPEAHSLTFDGYYKVVL